MADKDYTRAGQKFIYRVTGISQIANEKHGRVEVISEASGPLIAYAKLLALRAQFPDIRNCGIEAITITTKTEQLTEQRLVSELSNESLQSVLSIAKQELCKELERKVNRNWGRDPEVEQEYAEALNRLGGLKD